MEKTQSKKVEVLVKAIEEEEIIIHDTKEINIKGEEIKTTQYFLNVKNQDTNSENQETQYVTVEECDETHNQFVTVEVDESNPILIEDKDVILWNELCRICANSSDRFIPIFTGEGLEHNLCNKIHTYLPVRVSESDTLPLQLCYSCAATLLAWHEMSKGCLDAQQRLIDLQTKFQLKEQYYNESTMEEETVLEVETTANEESQIQDEPADTEQEIQVVDLNDTDRCMKIEDGQVIAILATFPTFPKRREKRKAKGQVGGLKNLPKKPRKSKGDESSESSRNLQRRLEAAQAKIVVDGTTYFKCDFCLKVLTTSYNYFAHKRIHTHEKPCTCQICGKSFTASSSLTRHVRDVHEKIKDYGCRFCERRLASKIARDEHERTHTDERPHVCTTCGKTFRQRASLSVHKRFHSTKFSFNCSQCNRGFPRKQDMERHELTHTDQKPYGCKLCPKSFRSSASAIRHRQTHDTRNKCMCDVCGESFNQERYLVNHKKKLHNLDR